VVAESAVEAALVAEETAWDAKAEIEALRLEIALMREERAAVVEEAVVEDELSPEPVVKEAEVVDVEDEKPKKKTTKKGGYGSSTWFGR